MESTFDINGSNRNNNICINKFVDEHPILKSFIAGSTSGLFSTVLFQPFDVVKTVLQNPRNDNKLGIINATKSVWQQESYYGFWRGLSPVSIYLFFILYSIKCVYILLNLLFYI
ncbi:mitochondrial glycine transporter B-like [Acyrthosiphon pisum]|uniref:Uncharacterized protein n=1 Tax=Acyrthosiphon pisum TaxID=7029 RepID=A0A8R2FB79_ACYPI|nr:mitochondrial glycine transporter B-like [Acyrthosiphon pisum]|eukprot:XP_008187104.2 PREDICTED: solute carrier family 25 member 38-B-like [Acyrthosiphon pisum]